MQKVSIIQREIPHYRVRFFEELYAQGKLQGLDIHVCTGAPPAQAASSPAFSYHVLPLRYFGKKKSGSCWMYGLEKAIAGSDIVVAPQGLQCLTVPYLWAKRKRIRKTWIWWGHGYNFQASVRSSISTSAKEAITRFMTRRTDGSITYTARGTEYWRQRGMAADRVMPYFNTLDIEALREAGARVTEQELQRVRQQLRLEGQQVLLFSGRLYLDKEVDFLLKAVALLQRSCPNVALLVLGNGSERTKLEELRDTLNIQHVHFLGEISDTVESSVYFRLAHLLVIPGLVGLAIVHGFAFELPLVTTERDSHSPEIEYLTQGNGVMTTHEHAEYAAEIVRILSSPKQLALLRAGCAQTAQQLMLGASPIGLFVRWSNSQDLRKREEGNALRCRPKMLPLRAAAIVIRGTRSCCHAASFFSFQRLV